MTQDEAAAIRNDLIPMTWETDTVKCRKILQTVWDKVAKIVERDEANEEKHRQQLLTLNKNLRENCERLEAFLKGDRRAF